MTTNSLDCSRRGPCLLWFFAGAVLAAVMLVGEVQVMGSWAGLLHIRTVNPLFDRLDSELGPLVKAPVGHDGELFYLVARDPLGTRGTPQALIAFDKNGPRYRYRRILYPLLAGGFGQLGAKGTLAGMIVLVIIGMGLIGMALADIAGHFKLERKTVIFALVNPGAIAAAFLLTADPLALGLALGGIALALRQRTSWALSACALAVLTKELYLLVPCALACWHWQQGRKRLACAFAIVPVAPLLAWSAWLAFTSFPDGVAATNLGMPLRGLLEAVPLWGRLFRRQPFELILGAVACLMLVRGAMLMVTGREPMLRWLVAPWVVLGCIATFRVWGAPNNAARVLAILWPLNMLLLGMQPVTRTRRSTSSST